MNSFAAAASPVAIPPIPIEWITSGAVSPVAPGVAAPALTSPAASAATGWSPQRAYVDSHGGNGSILDAIASALMGASPGHAAQANANAQAQAQVQAQVQAQQQLAMMSPQSGMSMAVAPGVMAAPSQVMAPPSQVMAPPSQVMAPPSQVMAAPSQPVAAVSAPASGAAAAPAPQDPTLVRSVTGAIAGFSNATGRTLGAVAGAGVSTGRKVGTELWAGVRSPRSIHVTQVPSKYNAAPAAGNRDCGPVSVVMTLKLLGKTIPGAAAGASPQKLVNRVRSLTGNVANSVPTTNIELGRALRAAGTKTREIADADSIRRAVTSGKPVVLNGNPRNPGAYGPSFSDAQMTPYNGRHWIVVSGIDEKSGKFIINDPLSKIGPVKVTPAQLEGYRGGSLGIEVEA